jgi:uncharacterized Ntn-hydrolase superfamily protein
LDSGGPARILKGEACLEILGGKMDYFPGEPFNTFTMIGRCERSGLLGICIASSPLSVTARCPFIQGNLGAISTQAFSNPGLGPFALKLLSIGYSPEGAIEEIKCSDRWIEYRQIGIVDRTGTAAVFTGSNNQDWKGHIGKKNYVAMGNHLASGQVVENMARAFEDSSTEILEERLLRAIEAGRDAGGEISGQLSAGLIVYGADPYPRTDLRVDRSFSGDPIADLRRIFEEYRILIPFYEQRPLNPTMGGWRDWIAKLK